MTPPLLSIEDLVLDFDTFDGVYKALDGVSLALRPGEALGVVGETGCGKSITARSVLRLVQAPPARYRGGRILFGGEDLLRASDARLRSIRGVEIAMIFQDPMTFLNPVLSIGVQMEDAILAHERLKPKRERMDRRAARRHAEAMLERVYLSSPGRVLDSYPHELSGGMRQRVLIAMALSGRPKILIADEPTTALDVTIQAQILDLIRELMTDFDLSVILISHDLGVIATICDRVVVMYAGQVAEVGTVAELFGSPSHPYTQGLLAAVPHPERPAAALQGIPGTLPNLLSPPDGCRFRGRCTGEMPTCSRRPPAHRFSATHEVRCWLHAGQADA